MSALAEIHEARSSPQLAADSHRIENLPVLVLFPHSRCNCRCMMCDIWKVRQVREITEEDLKPHRDSLRTLKVRWIVFSGGEPLMHSNLEGLSRLCRVEGIRLTLLTAGLLLEPHASMIVREMDDVIVSLDGPPEIHDGIRGVPNAYSRLAKGVRAVRTLNPRMQISARCTVQKQNFRHLRRTVRTARDLELNSLSFLAADVTSEAFNRAQGWSDERQSAIALTSSESDELHNEMEDLIRECHDEIEAGFIAEGPEKLRRIVRHFRARLGQVEPVAPRCNAPWVSAVVEADGALRPCFFHHPIGNLRDGPLHDVLNGRDALNFRKQLNVQTNPVCQSCVCSLYIPAEARSGKSRLGASGAQTQAIPVLRDFKS